jgi:hypothetical protein
MNIVYFAHNGVEHATAAEAAAHEQNINWPVIAAVTVVVVLAGLVVTKILSGSQGTEDKPAKKEKKS